MEVKNKKQSQRVKVTCQCGKEFSTHSTHRQVCFTCKPKCAERHSFGVAPDGVTSFNGVKVVVPA